MLKQKEWEIQNGPITKNGVLPVTTLFLWKFCFEKFCLKRVDFMYQLSKPPYSHFL